MLTRNLLLELREGLKKHFDGLSPFRGGPGQDHSAGFFQDSIQKVISFQ